MNPSYIYGIQQYIARREKGKYFKSTFKCFLIKIIIMQWLIVEKMVDGVERKMGGGVLKNGWIFLLGVHLMKIKNESSEAYLIV